jgi:protein-S-isoprenylcysteine O-methyltransferase Ste14
MTLRTKIILQCTASFLIAAVVLFGTAGTTRYWQGWVYLAIVLTPMFIFSAHDYKHDPALVERRLRSREREKPQKVVMKIANVMAIAILMVPGFDYRFGWSKRLFGQVPPIWLEVVGMVLSLTSYLTTMYVIDVNRFAGRTVQVDEGQQLVSTGPYGIVRHPMYSAAVVMTLFTPLALGSYIAVPFCLLFIPLMVVRLLNEEKVLRRDLPGYPEYCERTRYRLIPQIW